jgi:hypothetical protein
MIEITKTEVCGWDAAIRGMRNPLNSWAKSDSAYSYDPIRNGVVMKVGENDLDLMKRLVKSGSDHSKFMRMITVTCDLNAPLYWWKEYDTYKVGTVANSCSTMHKIHAKEFTMDDFSTGHLLDENRGNCFIPDPNDGYYSFSPLDVFETIIEMLNKCRNLYLATRDKRYWWQMIQLLPTSYNQKRTVLLNYAVLRNIYHARKTHKLDEWHTFCRWIEGLPYSELITMEAE